jgi:hypothetical protein
VRRSERAPSATPAAAHRTRPQRPAAGHPAADQPLRMLRTPAAACCRRACPSQSGLRPGRDTLTASTATRWPPRQQQLAASLEVSGGLARPSHASIGQRRRCTGPRCFCCVFAPLYMDFELPTMNDLCTAVRPLSGLLPLLPVRVHCVLPLPSLVQSFNKLMGCRSGERGALD